MKKDSSYSSTGWTLLSHLSTQRPGGGSIITESAAKPEAHQSAWCLLLPHWSLHQSLSPVSWPPISNSCLCGSLFNNGSALVGLFSFLAISPPTIYRVIFPKPRSDHGTALSESLPWCLTVGRTRAAGSRLLPRQLRSLPGPLAAPSCLRCSPGGPSAPGCLPVCVYTDCAVALPLIWVISF